MKKIIALCVLIATSLFITPLQAKLYWESPETWKSYFPYVTFINKTNYDLELAIVTTHGETEWQPIAKNETLPIVFTHQFKEILAKLPTINPLEKNGVYNFTKQLQPDLQKIEGTLNDNPHAAIKIEVVIKENNNPFKSNKALTLKYHIPDITVVVHTEQVTTHRTAAVYKVAQAISTPPKAANQPSRAGKSS